MLRKIIKEEKFLDKFTEEMILNTKKAKSKPIEKIIKKIESPKEQTSQPLQPIVPKPIPISPPPRALPPRPIQPRVSQPQTPPQKIEQKPKRPILPPRPINLSEKKQVKSEELQVTNIPLPPRPITIAPGQIDFGKINFLVQDPLITQIEAPGDKKNIIIKKAGNIIRTQITLTKEEILAIINSFSEAARIPLVEGMLIARIGNLEMTAVVSASEGSNVSFILRKEPIPIMIRPPTQLMRPLMQITPAQSPRPMPFIPPQNPRPQTPAQPQNLPNTQNSNK